MDFWEGAYLKKTGIIRKQGIFGGNAIEEKCLRIVLNSRKNIKINQNRIDRSTRNLPKIGYADSAKLKD